MSITNILVVFCCLLAFIMFFLHKKNAEKHEMHVSCENALKERNEYISRQLNDNHTCVVSRLDMQEKEIKKNLQNMVAEDKKLFSRIDMVDGEIRAIIDQQERKIVSFTEELFREANERSNKCEVNSRIYTDERIKEIVDELENRIGILTNVLESVSEENEKLRQELIEQKKKLNFYANIEEQAENLNVQDDKKERDRLLALAAKQILANREKKHKDKSEEKTESNNQSQCDIGCSKDGGYENKGRDVGEDEDTCSLLDKEQMFASSYMDTTNENVFITGKAGTGKSFLLDSFRTVTEKSHVVLAPTGIAALNVNGATLHSAFGYFNLVNLGVDDITSKTIRLKSEKQDVLRRVQTIIIDEISMVRADTFDKIDRILKVLNKSEEPFGGKQMLIFGDLFQLPPVTKGQEYNYLLDRYGGIFFFHSEAYKNGNFKFIELTENHRQKGDQQFFEILNRIREGHTTNEDIDLLNTRYTSNEDKYDRFVSLFPTKAEAERVNREHLNQLESREFVYCAKILLDKSKNKTKNFESTFPIMNELRLRLGASVMMVANDPEHRWVNGTLGIVERLTEDSIYVSFGQNRTYEIHPFEFDEQEVTYINGEILYEKVFSVSQYPIVPAYAITIHKSQGQTYRNVACDVDRCFANGQAYVALSRCASLEGLHLKKRIKHSSIKVDSEILAFYKEQVSNSILQ